MVTNVRKTLNGVSKNSISYGAGCLSAAVWGSLFGRRRLGVGTERTETLAYTGSYQSNFYFIKTLFSSIQLLFEEASFSFFFVAQAMPSHAVYPLIYMVALHTLLSGVMCVACCNVIFSSLQSSLIMSIHRFFGLPLFLTP